MTIKNTNLPVNYKVTFIKHEFYTECRLTACIGEYIVLDNIQVAASSERLAILAAKDLIKEKLAADYD